MESQFLPPELWEKIVLTFGIENISKIRLFSKFFNELILNNKILKFYLILASNDQYKEDPITQFVWACKEGKIDLVKWLFDVYSKNTYDISPSFIIPKNYYREFSVCVIDALEGACGIIENPIKYGPIPSKSKGMGAHFTGSKLETVKWLVETYNYPVDIIYSFDGCAFQRACISGNLDIAKFLFRTFRIPSCSITEGYVDYGIYGKITQEQQRIYTNIDTFGGSCSIRYDGKDYSSTSREKTQLKIVKWLVKKLKLTQDKNAIILILTEVFQHNKTYVPIDILRFLIKKFNLTTSNIGLGPELIRHHVNESVIGCYYNKFSLFRAICSSGQLDSIKWLIEWYIEKEKIIPLRSSERPEKYTLEIDQELVDIICTTLWDLLGGKTENYLQKIQTAKWLINTFNISIKNMRKTQQDIIKIAWTNGHSKFVEWAARKFGCGIFDDMNLAIFKAIEKAK